MAPCLTGGTFILLIMLVLHSMQNWIFLPTGASCMVGVTIIVAFCFVAISGSVPIQGFTLQARRLGTQAIVGYFKTPSSSGVKAYNCDTVSDTLVAWYDPQNASKKSTFTWYPPADDVGTIHFIGTVFKNENTFWENVKSTNLRKGFQKIDVSTCGKEKGCFRYSREVEECTHDTCEYIVTYRRDKDGNALFELSALAEWVAIGFSSDAQMGGDDVFMCVTEGNTVKVQRYFTEFAYTTPKLQSDNPLFNHQVDIGDNGRISCSFSRPLKIHNDMKSVDLNNDWYQLYAWGPVASSGTIMRHKLESPPTSGTKTILTRNNNVLAGGHMMAVCQFLSLLSIVIAFLIPRLNSSNHFT